MRHLDIATAAPVVVDGGAAGPWRGGAARGARDPAREPQQRDRRLHAASARRSATPPTGAASAPIASRPSHGERSGGSATSSSFSFVRTAADPYGNHCAPSVWGAVPQSGSAASSRRCTSRREPSRHRSSTRKHGVAKAVGRRVGGNLLDRRFDARTHRCELIFVASRTNFRLGQNPPDGRRTAGRATRLSARQRQRGAQRCAHRLCRGSSHDDSSHSACAAHVWSPSPAGSSARGGARLHTTRVLVAGASGRASLVRFARRYLGRALRLRRASRPAPASTAPASPASSTPTSGSRCRISRPRSSRSAAASRGRRSGPATSSSSTGSATSGSTSAAACSSTRRTPARGSRSAR